MGSVGVDEDGCIMFVNQTLWDTDEMGRWVDGKGKELRNKTTTLEFAGLIIPFLLYPELVRNQHVIVQVDNLGCFFAWENGYTKEDNTASMLVRVLVLLSMKLCCVIHVKHLPRESSWESKLTDRLSRESSTKAAERELLHRYEKRSLPKVFKDWMQKPREDWTMPTRLLQSL